MITIKLKKGLSGDKVVRLYSGIKELPIDRYHEFNKLVLQDLGLGSDLNAIGERFKALHQLLSNGNTAEAWQEAQNLHNTFYYILQDVDIKSFCFAALIESINGERLTDLSDENIRVVLGKLSRWGLTQGHVAEVVNDVKKNLIQNFEPVFLIDTEIPQPLTLTSN